MGYVSFREGMENPIKMDDLGVSYHYFWKHPYVNAPEKIMRSNEHEVRIRFFRIRSFCRKIMLFLTPSIFFSTPTGPCNGVPNGC